MGHIYHNGEKNGEFIEYFINKKIKCKYNYEHNELSGYFYVFDENENILRHDLYCHGFRAIHYILTFSDILAGTFIKKKIEYSNPICCICRESKKELIMLECGHIYHRECLINWYKNHQHKCCYCLKMINWNECMRCWRKYDKN